MSTFITSDDYGVKISDNRLQMIIEQDNTLLDDAESTAIAVVKDALYPYYNTETIFATTGEDRPAQVVRWVLCLSLYYLYERIPDKLVPQRVKDNYRDTLDKLQRISDQIESVNLPRVTDNDGAIESKFRWGGESARLHR